MNELENYVRFESDDPAFDFSFLYPRVWQVREIHGAGYDEVFILGPRNRENTLSLSLVVRVKPTQEHEEPHSNLDELVADYSARHKGVISKTDGYLGEARAVEIEREDTIPLPPNTVHATPTSVRERRILFKRDGHLYQVIYTAVAEDYYRYLDALKTAVRTFEFREESSVESYQPLILPTLTHAVREKPLKYSDKDQ